MEGQSMVAAPNAAGEMMAWSPKDVLGQIQMIQQLMKDGMTEGEHYGTIPGCGDRKVLMKSGAEKLCLMFRLAPKFETVERDLGGGHREITVKCALYHINTEKFWGSGMGSCSTMETKYRYRTAKRKCPSCGSEAIIKTRTGRNPGGYWCVPDRGGCNANFNPGDTEVESQELGRVENPDIADTYNTVLKIAKKRAHVDATITATAASDIFTQDLDETLPEEPAVVPQGNPAVKGATPVAAKPEPLITPEQADTIIALTKEAGITGEVLLAEIKKNGGQKVDGKFKVAGLPASQYENCVAWLKGLAAKKAAGKEFDAEIERYIKAGIPYKKLAAYCESMPFASDEKQMVVHLQQLRSKKNEKEIEALFDEVIARQAKKGSAAA